jgi:hypothetical protein
MFAQDQPTPFTFPVKDGKVIYEEVVDVSGKDMLSIYSKATSWYFKTFKGSNDKVVNSDASIGQFVADVQSDIDDVFYMKYTIQIDCKENKYRVRFTNIRHTVKGKENTAFFAKYLVNVPAENDNEIFLTEKKGFNKSQRGVIQKRMMGMDAIFNGHMASLKKAINVKAEDF